MKGYFQLFICISSLLLKGIVIYAQDYKITFALLDSNNKPDSVIVENLDKAIGITLNGYDTLYLVDHLTKMNESRLQTESLFTYPNPFSTEIFIEFYNPRNCMVITKIHDLAGQLIMENSSELPQGKYIYKASGFKKGCYIFTINTGYHSFSKILISMDDSDSDPKLTIDRSDLSYKKNAFSNSRRELLYNSGDQLRLTAYLDTLNSIQEAIINDNKQVEFDFTPPKADFSIMDTIVIIDSAINFFDYSYSNSEIEQWSWDFGDNSAISSDQNPTHSYHELGTYTVTLSVRNKYGVDRKIMSDIIRVYNLVDIDKNGYYSVVIGAQEWMTENLKTTRYADGTDIPYVENDSVWFSLKSNDFDDAFCYYNNDSTTIHGALYKWAAAMGDSAVSSSTNPSGVQGACPDGWHIPSSAEWKEMENYLIVNGYNYDESIAGDKTGKSLASTFGWKPSSNEGAVGNNQSTNNSSGFSGLPSGSRDGTGSFEGLGRYCGWWSSTANGGVAVDTYFLYNYASILGTSQEYKMRGYSVRCVRKFQEDGSEKK